MALMALSIGKTTLFFLFAYVFSLGEVCSLFLQHVLVQGTLKSLVFVW